MATLKTRLILRNDVTAKWANVVLLKGEAGVEWRTNSGETTAKPKIKIGDGSAKWSDLPYIQDGFISTTVETEGTGNTVVDASVEYDADTGIYSITLTKANRVVDIGVADDDVVILDVDADWDEGHTITASHATQGPSNTTSTTSTSNANVSIDPTEGGKLSVPQITVNEYGHTTAIVNQEVAVAGHDITVTSGDTGTAGNTIVGLSKGDNHEVKYTTANRVIPSDTLASNQIILGNGTYNVKASGKTIVTTLGNDHTTVPTSKAVGDAIATQVAGAVQYLGTISAVASLSPDAGKGDFYRASADVEGVWHAGDLIIAEKDKPSKTVDGTNWSVVHGEDVGVVELEAGTGITINNADSAAPTVNVKLKDSTVQTVAATNVSTTANRTYAIQVNSDNQLVVNVPWSTGTDNRDPGYGMITPANNSTVVDALLGNDTQIKAGTYNENVKFTAANKWIVLAGASGSGNGNDEMKWGHILSGVTAGTYGQSTAKALTWKEDDTNPDTFTVVKPTVDKAGHITSISDITITAPNTVVDTSLRGLAPKITATNSFLVAKNGATQASWEQVLIIDGGNASTTAWGIISDT